MDYFLPYIVVLFFFTPQVCVGEPAHYSPPVVEGERFADYYANLSSEPLQRLFVNKTVCLERDCWPKNCYVAESVIKGTRLLFIRDECMGVAGGSYNIANDIISVRADMAGDMKVGLWVLAHEYGHHVGLREVFPSDYTDKFADDYANSAPLGWLQGD